MLYPQSFYNVKVNLLEADSMIVDQISYIWRYKGMSDNLDKAIGFIEKNDLKALPLGLTPIDGSNVYAKHFIYETTETPAHFENHVKYIDLQIALTGSEQIALALVDHLIEHSYDDVNDSADLTGPEENRVSLKEGQFMLLFPGEAHIPKLMDNKKEQVNKLILKILY